MLAHLKRNTLPTISNFKDPSSQKRCQCNEKHLQHLSRRRGGARFKVFCNFEAGIRRQQPRRHLLGKIHFCSQKYLCRSFLKKLNFLIFRQGMSILKRVCFRLFQWEHSPFCLRVAEWNHAGEVCADGLTSLKSHWKKNYTVKNIKLMKRREGKRWNCAGIYAGGHASIFSPLWSWFLQEETWKDETTWGKVHKSGLK